MDFKYIHKAETDILKEIDKLCKKHNIKYFLYASGTLLGAVRHNGFVPWDDDLDIAFFRDDYERFLKIAHKELTSPYFLCESRFEPRYTNIFAKIFKTDAKYSSVFFKNNLSINGVWVDIFPVDLIFAKDLEEAKNKITKRISKIGFLSILLENRKNPSKTLSPKIRLLCRFSSILPKSFYFNIINKIYTADSKKNGNFCTCYAGNRLKETYPISDILPLKPTTFEGINVLIPNSFDTVLKSVFGNYLELPPEEKRKSSHDLILNEEK